MNSICWIELLCIERERESIAQRRRGNPPFFFHTFREYCRPLYAVMHIHGLIVNLKWNQNVVGESLMCTTPSTCSTMPMAGNIQANPFSSSGVLNILSTPYQCPSNTHACT